MQILCGIFTTKHLPHTHKILASEIPSIFSSKCYNPQGLTFEHEVRNTEIGHLYEHILLELIADEKRLTTKNIGKIKGVTEWNWIDEPRGTFHIHLTVGEKDKEILKRTIHKANNIMNDIIAPTTSISDLNNPLHFC